MAVLPCTSPVSEVFSAVSEAGSAHDGGILRACRRTTTSLISLLGWPGSEVRSGTQPMAPYKASRRSQLLQAFGRPADETQINYFLVLRCCSVQSQRMPEAPVPLPVKTLIAPPPLRYGPAIPLRREAVLELDVVGREPQRSYRRQTSSTQRQAQVTGVRGVCVR